MNETGTTTDPLDSTGVNARDLETALRHVADALAELASVLAAPVPSVSGPLASQFTWSTRSRD